MYLILINDDNTMTATVKQRIVQRSKLVDTLSFIVKPSYNGFDMSAATVLMEYMAPVSKRYRTEVLVPSHELYKEHIMYNLPVDTKLTEEAGDVEVQVSFIYVDMDMNGNVTQRVRKTAPAHKITVVPISAWSDVIPDDALSVIDQRIIKMDAQIRAIEDMNNAALQTKADDIRYDVDENTLQLLAGNTEIGSPVKLRDGGEMIKDGVPVVDFTKINSDGDEVLPEEVDNVVEF